MVALFRMATWCSKDIINEKVDRRIGMDDTAKY
jgi:hypothetical protein